MRLFKYYGFHAGIAAIDSSRLGFRGPDFFNDPFELTSLLDRQAVSCGGFIGESIKDIASNVVICSLTRSCDNELMWSHYSDNHEGFVVEYDVENKFLNSTEFCLVPAYDGAVIYHSKKNSRPLRSVDLDRLLAINLQSMGGCDFQFDDRARALARQLFLTKKACWSYEEEVRIVKIKDSFFHDLYDFKSDVRRDYSTLCTPEVSNDGIVFIEDVPGLVIFKYKIKIKNIYLGLRNKIMAGQNADKLGEWRCRNFGIYRMEIDKATWRLKKVLLRS